MPEITAWHYSLEQPVTGRWENGRITAIDPARENPPRTRWIAPPLVDLQINGFAGVDFQSDDVSLDDLETAVRGLYGAGCARLFLTLISDEWPRLLARLQRLRELRRKSQVLSAA